MGIPLWKEPSVSQPPATKQDLSDPLVARRSAIRRIRAQMERERERRARIGAAVTAASPRHQEGGGPDAPIGSSANEDANPRRSSQTFLDLLSERARAGGRAGAMSWSSPHSGYMRQRDDLETQERRRANARDALQIERGWEEDSSSSSNSSGAEDRLE